MLRRGGFFRLYTEGGNLKKKASFTAVNKTLFNCSDL